MKQAACFIIPAGLLFGLVRCTSLGPVAGTSVNSGNARIAASIVYPDGSPAAGAMVRLRRSDYVAQPPGLGKSAVFGADALTDSSGLFQIYGADTGAYMIEASSPSIGPGQSGAVIFACTLGVKKTINLGADTLRPFATVIGAIDTTGSPASNSFVQIAGLERLTQVGVDGRYSFADLPAGLLSLHIVRQGQSAAPLVIDSVSAVSGDTAIAPSPLPAPWQALCENETPRGGAMFAGGMFTVAGGGPDIWSTADGFHFVYQAWHGDVSVIARVKRLDSTDLNAKACLMIRQNLTAPAMFGVEEMKPGGWPIFQWRGSIGDTTPFVSGAAVAFPRWIKLERRGDTLTGYNSPDGVNWIAQKSAVVIMPADIYVGLAVTSHRLDKTCIAEFDGVRISP